MNRKVITTADGSTTIHLEDWNEHYHSKHGAIQEAYHVFIKKGLDFLRQDSLAILEIGFGTGLNALITILEAEKKGLTVSYTGVEAYPVPKEELVKLNYTSQLGGAKTDKYFQSIHDAPWNQDVELCSFFKLHKAQLDFHDIREESSFHLIYFDAFGPRVQPELWSVELFRKMHSALKPGGVLVTYSAKGSVRRAMQEVGFTVERLPGPPGKREMLRALKD